MDWIDVTAIGLLAGVFGTGLGGLLVFLFLRPSERILGFMLGFAGGVMLTIVFIELLDEASTISFPFSLLGLALGILIFLLLDSALPHYHYITEDNKRNAYIKKGILIAIGIALHNFPEGLAIGAGFAASSTLGITLAILIALHNIPEGLAVALPLHMGGVKNTKILLFTLLAGLPMGLGAFTGAWLGNISPIVLCVSLSFAAGAMFYIVCDEIISETYQMAGPHLAIVGISGGVVVGMTMIHYL